MSKPVHIAEGENIDDVLFEIAKIDEAEPDILNLHRITAEGHYPQAEPVVFIESAAFAARENVSAVSGPAKGGKTGAISAILAQTLTPDGWECDGIAGVKALPANGKAVIYLDTEQAAADQQYQVKTIHSRAGITRTPDNFFAHNIRELSPKDKIKFTGSLCEAAAAATGGIHVIVIDGGADYLKSVNDEQESTEAVLFFMRLSTLYNCPVIIVVHTNPGGEKERGHFGSDLQRKCYGLINVTREGDVSTLSPKLLRKAGMKDAPLIHFTYDQYKGYHTACDDPKSNAVQAREKSIALTSLTHQVFEGHDTLPHGKIILKIQAIRDVKETTAKDEFRRMIANELIEKIGPGKTDPYRLVIKRAERAENGRPPLS
ncbi:MAG: AAA family ATPase [Sphingobacteriales bacterium]|nr:AAA family ATPase [Sphingobacteriales bacterium]